MCATQLPPAADPAAAALASEEAFLQHQRMQAAHTAAAYLLTLCLQTVPRAQLAEVEAFVAELRQGEQLAYATRKLAHAAHSQAAQAAALAHLSPTA